VLAGGRIGFGEILSAGTTGAGGAVTLHAAGNIDGGTIGASGLNGGRGGTVTITATAGDIAVDAIAADGGSGLDANGGAGGSIALTAGGQVRVRSRLSALGGQVFSGTADTTASPAFAAGAGGQIAVTAAGDVVIGARGGLSANAAQVRADGGAAFTTLGAANGGAGGVVSLTSTGGGIDLFGTVGANGGTPSTAPPRRAAR
jgi:hypothetical protein